jgi:hypothetical protein
VWNASSFLLLIFVVLLPCQVQSSLQEALDQQTTDAEERLRQCAADTDAAHNENVRKQVGGATPSPQCSPFHFGLEWLRTGFHCFVLTLVCIQVQLRDQLSSSSSQLQRLHDALQEADEVRSKVCSAPAV